MRKFAFIIALLISTTANAETYIGVGVDDCAEGFTKISEGRVPVSVSTGTQCTLPSTTTNASYCGGRLSFHTDTACVPAFGGPAGGNAETLANFQCIVCKRD